MSFASALTKPAIALRVFLFALPVLAVGCDQFDFALPAERALQTAEETSQYVVVPDGRSWVRAPDSLLTLERTVGADREQRLALTNRTTIAGDNWLLMRARVQGSDRAPLRLSEFLERTGGVPTPFANVRDGDLRSGEDQLGPYVWAEQRLGVSTICVLGLRRVTQAGRLLPGDTNVLDIMMRNCVDGTVQQALAPFGADRIAYFPSTATNVRMNENRNISPLAAPMP